MRRFLGKLGVSLPLAVALVWVFTSSAMADTIASHREAWEADTVSRTLAANRAGAAAG